MTWWLKGGQRQAQRTTGCKGEGPRPEAVEEADTAGGTRRGLEVRGLGYRVRGPGAGPGRGACERKAQVQARPPRQEPPDSICQDFSRFTWTLLIYLKLHRLSAGRAHRSASPQGGALRGAESGDAGTSSP